MLQSRPVVAELAPTEDTLEEFNKLLRDEGAVPVWHPVDEVLHDMRYILRANGVVLDEVNPVFSQSEPVMNFEEYLRDASQRPARVLACVADGDHHLDDLEDDLYFRLHRYSAPLTQEEVHWLLGDTRHRRPALAGLISTIRGMS